ncbi:transposase, partial [Chromobacterium amazonense]|uniref:transposase n=1 Tax=Chromobacterium amazonense TaxID=1382803 RepID=UPI00237ED50D
MSKVRPPYPAAFRQQMVEFVQAGHSPAELSREFGVTAQSIINWVGQAAVDAGKPLPGKDSLTTAEREELVRLRKQLRQAQMGSVAQIPGRTSFPFSQTDLCHSHRA